MSLLKTSLLAGMLLLCQQSLASICVNTSANHELLFRGDVLNHGYDMAFQDSHFSDYQLFSSDTNSEFVTQIQKMTSGHCSIVLGLFTSHDCLIAGPILKKNKTIGISSLCGHDDVSKFYPYLYTRSYSMSQEADAIAAYINSIPNLGKVFAIYQPANLYSATQFSLFKQKFAYSIIEVPVRLDGQFDLDEFSYKKGEKATLIFFTYPLPSVKILVELSNRKLINKDTRIIGSSSWNDDVSVLTSAIKPILRSANEVVAFDELDWKKVKNSSFTRKFIKKFNREPLNVEILNYDVARFAVKCYKEALVNGKYNIDLFQHCLTNIKYQGVSGVFSFSNHASFADHPQIYLTDLFDRI